MLASKTPELKRSNGKHTNNIWLTAASPTGFSKLSPDDLLWFTDYWHNALPLTHLAETEGANSETASSDSRAGHQTSANVVRWRLNVAIKTLCLAAEQRGLNSAKIHKMGLIIRERLPQAAKWCFSDDDLGWLPRAEDFLSIRFPASARPTAEEQQDFKDGVDELNRLRRKLELESEDYLRLCIPGEGTRGREVIQVLFERKAFDAAHRMTAEQITDCAPRCRDANLFKHSIGTLRRDGWIDTKPGKGGGSWLTPLGLQMASELFKR